MRAGQPVWTQPDRGALSQVATAALSTPDPSIRNDLFIPVASGARRATVTFNGVSDPADDLSDAPPLTLSNVSNPLVYTFAPHVRVHHLAEAEHDSADADARAVFAFDPAISYLRLNPEKFFLTAKTPPPEGGRRAQSFCSSRSPTPLLVAGSRLCGEKRFCRWTSDVNHSFRRSMPFCATCPHKPRKQQRRRQAAYA